MNEPFDRNRRRLMGALLALAAVPVLAATNTRAQDKDALHGFGGATTWLNSPQLGPAELRGKVVLVDFWTYTCINWLRTAPYVRAWADKYKDQGLVVIGVHTPEFEFEKDLRNVRREVQAMQVTWPVAVDSDYAIWRAFSNNAWPAVYLIDAKGRVRYSHLGEEEYERTERMIQQMLAESGRMPGKGLVSVEGRGAEAAPDWASLRSPETYLGSERTGNRVNTAPARLRLNQWTVTGNWASLRNSIVLNKPNGRLAFRFHARDVHLVMGPAAARGSEARFRILIDGKPPGAAHGVDVDGQGNGTVTEQRLHQLIRQPKPIAERLFEIEFLDPGVEAYAFTFG
jgi:thiol-disulfide isomerase/thioredoxin